MGDYHGAVAEVPLLRRSLQRINHIRLKIAGQIQLLLRGRNEGPRELYLTIQVAELEQVGVGDLDAGVGVCTPWHLYHMLSALF